MSSLPDPVARPMAEGAAMPVPSVPTRLRRRRLPRTVQLPLASPLTVLGLALPLAVLIIAIVAVLGPSFTNLVLVLGVSGWVPFARIMLRHLLPNTMTPVIIFTTFDFARLLLIESALSFSGLGVQPPTPSWGAMIADGRQYLFEAWWNSALPGAAIVAAVLAFNFVGDGLRDALDPFNRQD